MGFGEEDLADGGSDALVDALVAQGDAATAAKQLRTQLEAGASHVVVHAVPTADRLRILTALAPELGVAAHRDRMFAGIVIACRTAWSIT